MDIRMMIDLIESVTLGVVAALGHLMAFGRWCAERVESGGYRRRIYELRIATGQLRRELKNSLCAPVHAVLLLLCLVWGLFRETGLISFLVSLLITAVVAEVWHYFSHRAFHTRALLWIHREHHRSLLSSPFTAVSTSLIEKLIFSLGILGILAVCDTFIDLNFFGIATWYVAYIALNSYAHANFETKPGSFLNGRGRFFTSTTYHSLHHARYVNNYGLGTRVLDRIFGTEWEDYEQVFERVAVQDKPLTRLKERLDCPERCDRR